MREYLDKTCIECGDLFSPTGPNTKWCESCSFMLRRLSLYKGNKERRAKLKQKMQAEDKELNLNQVLEGILRLQREHPAYEVLFEIKLKHQTVEPESISVSRIVN